ncbi:MAG: imidazolonepropionase [Polyangiaceae bacterium]|nr:imidazolonepropionase [Polyangiaceae bacterium]MCK6532929.1 imidazolonepropionase [Polyangiaceae bacterium]
MTRADLLIVNAAEVVTCAGFSDAPARGADQSVVRIVRDGAVAIADGRILAVGASDRLRREHHVGEDQIIDAAGGIVLPGFVDCHTHLVFAGDRAIEWEQRMQGKPYLEILKEGGGILSTVKKTRASAIGALVTGAVRWATACMEHGTTTLEAKSGYCLDREGELRLLDVARTVQSELPISIVSTFLGAHVVPPEFKQNRTGYLELLDALMVEIRERQLATFVDVFCEQEAFTLDETERILIRAKSLGFGLKLHAEQFTSSGAAALGARLGAVSVDHLEHVDDAAIAALAGAPRPPVGVLLPGVPFHLAQTDHAPARRLIEAGVPVAIATDLNPGSSFTPSIPMCIALACRSLKMTASEAVVACTINAAHALGRGAQIGSLEPGKRADVIVCDVPDHRWLGYAFGQNPVRAVVVAGERVFD